VQLGWVLTGHFTIVESCLLRFAPNQGRRSPEGRSLIRKRSIPSTDDGKSTGRVALSPY
jgi:hypothetical protein